MLRSITSWFAFAVIAAAVVGAAVGQEDEAEKAPVFRSDVAMGRIDVQVLDHELRPVPNLTQDDFLLRRDQETVPIRDFSYQQMPVDVVLLLDVSGSMRPQVERVASASDRALRVLGDQDRVAIMTFTTGARVRMKFSGNREEIERKLDDTVSNSSFMGGTDINRALLDAVKYMVKEGRREARHAIVIVTDDLARPIDQQRVGTALSEADAVLIGLLTPAALQYGAGPPGSPGGYPGGGYPPVIIGSPWPGGRGGVWGPRYPGGGPPVPPVGSPPRMEHAGTAAAANESGGEAFPSSDAHSLEIAFLRIRQQYSMYFYLPDGATANDAAAIAVDLTNNARIRHRGVELRYRQVYLSGDTRRTFVKRVRPGLPEGAEPQRAADSVPSLAERRRPTSERTGPRVQITPQEPRDAPAESSEPEPSRRRSAVSEPRGPRVRTIP